MNVRRLQKEISLGGISIQLIILSVWLMRHVKTGLAGELSLELG